MITVGSRALSEHLLKVENGKDLDIWCSSLEQKSKLLNDPFLMEQVEKYGGKLDVSVVPESILTLIEPKGELRCAGLDDLYTIKLSHMSYPIFWNKHKKFILQMKKLGVKINKPLYEALIKHWENVHGTKDFLSLNKSKQSFFNDHVKYVYDHDYLHELAALPDKPVYTQCLKDDQEVFIDKAKFEALTFEDKVRMFMEEISVIATERWLVHKPGRYSYQQVWSWSLEKVVTSLTKGWASRFILENIEFFYKPNGKIFKNILSVIQPKEREINMSAVEFLKSKCVEALIKKKGYNPELDYDERFNNDIVEVFMGDHELDGFVWEDGHVGGEGGGEYCWAVIQVDGRYFKAEWSYYSHYGCETDNLVDSITEVFPKIKEVRVFE